MALIKCPFCGESVSSNADKCPHCGNNPNKKPRRKWKKKDYIILFSIIGAVVAIGIVLFLLLRPDPYLKKGRDYISDNFVQTYKEYIQSKVGRHIDLTDFDIRDFIMEEWDRKSCVGHFNLPLKDDSVYSVCAYSFYLKKVETLFVVFRYGEPILIKDRDGLAQEMESNICVVKKDGSAIHLDARDCLELDYLDAHCTVNGYPDFEKLGKELSAYIKQRYGEYEVICSCDGVDDAIRQNSSNKTHVLEVADETVVEEPLAEEYTEAVIDENDTQLKEHDLNVNLYGRIGGDNTAWLKIENGQGSYHFLDYTRAIRVKEYNQSSKKLIVHGYATGSGDYIGEFDGEFDGTTYQGTFTNYKGVKITFHLSRE